MDWPTLSNRLRADFAIGSKPAAERAWVIDSHTAGEPTRMLVAGLGLGHGELSMQLRVLRDEVWAKARAVVDEPRGHAGIVGAWVGAPSEPGQLLRVIFFNNVGALPMCIHGTIGVVASIAQTVGLDPGLYRLETPVGEVQARLADDGSVGVHGVPSRVLRSDLVLRTASHGDVRGALVWGGNWFFMAEDPAACIEREQVPRLQSLCLELRACIDRRGLRGDDERPIDHIHLSAPVLPGERGDDRCFVLCPGGAWDRSPCGTGTSAKLALLAQRGELAPGEAWRQLGPLGSAFEASYARVESSGSSQGQLIAPFVRGRAWVTGTSELRFSSQDPYARGLAPSKANQGGGS